MGIEHAADERQRVDDLPALVEGGVALDHEGHVPLAERRQVDLEVAGRPEEQRDVVERDAVPVVQLAHVARHGARLELRGAARREARRAPGGRVEAPRDPVLDGRVPRLREAAGRRQLLAREQRLEAGLEPGPRLHDRRDRALDLREHRRDGAEVHGQALDAPARGAHAGEERLVGREVRAPPAVDRLLGVADQEEAGTRGGGPREREGGQDLDTAWRRCPGTRRRAAGRSRSAAPPPRRAGLRGVGGSPRGCRQSRARRAGACAPAPRGAAGAAPGAAGRGARARGRARASGAAGARRRGRRGPRRRPRSRALPFPSCRARRSRGPRGARGLRRSRSRAARGATDRGSRRRRELPRRGGCASPARRAPAIGCARPRGSPPVARRPLRGSRRSRAPAPPRGPAMRAGARGSSSRRSAGTPWSSSSRERALEIERAEPLVGELEEVGGARLAERLAQPRLDDLARDLRLEPLLRVDLEARMEPRLEGVRRQDAAAEGVDGPHRELVPAHRERAGAAAAGSSPRPGAHPRRRPREAGPPRCFAARARCAPPSPRPPPR